MPDENKTPAVLKKDLPDELRPGVPIAGAGSEAPAPQAEEPAAPQAQPSPEEEKATVAKKTKAAAITYNILFVLLFLKIGDHGFGIDTTLSNLYSLDKDIRPHLLLFSAVICAVGAFFCIVPALFVRFVVVQKSLSDDLNCFIHVPLLVSLGVVGLLQRIEMGIYFVPLWILILSFIAHIFCYDKGGLFRTFFANIGKSFLIFFKRLFKA